MLTIRAVQMEAFGRQRRRDFEERLRVHLARVMAEAGRPVEADRLARQVSAGVTSGLRFFSAEKDVARYCEIVMTRLGGWDEADHPARALEMLKASVVEPARRLDSFETFLTRKRRR